LAKVLKIGNHELEVALDKGATGVAIVEPWAARAKASNAANYKWLWLIVAAIVVLWLMMHK
jgi:hypothetical protein